jgi:hypothetical protein
MFIARLLLRRFRALWQRGRPHVHVTTCTAALPSLPGEVAAIIEDNRRLLASGALTASLRDAMLPGASVCGFIANRYGDLYICSVRTSDEPS